MKIVLVVVGKTNEKYLIEGISDYQKRLKHYTNFEIVEISNIKNVKNHNNYHRNNKMFFVYVVMAILKDIPKFILLKLNLLHVFFESYKGMIEDSDSITNLK